MDIIVRLLVILLTFHISNLYNELYNLSNDIKQADYYRFSYKAYKFLWITELVLLGLMLVLFD